eukprot:scaffold62208_cov58-Attheya_sp.AAC.5
MASPSISPLFHDGSSMIVRQQSTDTPTLYAYCSAIGKRLIVHKPQDPHKPRRNQAIRFVLEHTAEIGAKF